MNKKEAFASHESLFWICLPEPFWNQIKEEEDVNHSNQQAKQQVNSLKISKWQDRSQKHKLKMAINKSLVGWWMRKKHLPITSRTILKKVTFIQNTRWIVLNSKKLSIQFPNHQKFSRIMYMKETFVKHFTQSINPNNISTKTRVDSKKKKVDGQNPT